MDGLNVLVSIKDMVSRNTGIDSEALTGDTPIKSLQLNSISFIRIIVEIEEKYDIEFEDDMLNPENIIYISDICDYIIHEIQAS